MTISEKIFEILDAKGISQKELSIATNIPQSTISDWRKKKTNPASDKILAICDFLGVSPYQLLSNVKEEGTRTNKANYRIVVEGTEEDQLIEAYEGLDAKARARLLGYLEALKN
ncbi:MAG: helix-turn-helix transcriptional regulator [Agathobacter sp.]|nr:helix-turn-helix transcriptional regulator [Agathobacter sp.]